MDRIYVLPRYNEWEKLIGKKWTEEDLLYNIGKAYFDNRKSLQCIQVWAGMIHRNSIVKEKLTRMPYLTRPVEEILASTIWADSKLDSKRLTWLDMLAALTRGRNKDAIGVVIVKMVANLFPRQ